MFFGRRLKEGAFDDQDGVLMLIRTSEPDWLKRALRAYADGRPFRFEDDSGLHINENDLRSGVILLKKARLSTRVSFRELAQLMAGLSIYIAGLAVIAVVLIDPDPTIQPEIVLGLGALLTITGGMASLRALGGAWNVYTRRGGSDIVVRPGR